MSRAKSSAHLSLSGDRATALGSRIRDARLDAALSQEQVSAASGLSVQHVRRLESGTANPTLGSLYALADALNQRLSALIPD